MAKQRSAVTINRNHRAFVNLVSYVNTCGVDTEKEMLDYGHVTLDQIKRYD